MDSDGSICIDYSEYEHWKYEKFARFVNKMLLRRDTYLHTSRLHFKNYHFVDYRDRLALCGSDIKFLYPDDELCLLEIPGHVGNGTALMLTFAETRETYLEERKLSKVTKGEETSKMPITGMTFECPLLETVIVQCSKDDNEIEQTVNAMVAHGVSLEKIQVIFHEDIERAERWGMSLEKLKEHDILEKARKENQERVDDNNAGSDNSDDDSEEMEDEEYDDDDDDEIDDDEDEMEDDDDDF
nr:unnamed protein product [Digitaria exilis]